MIEKRKILITGGAGKIGLHFVRNHAADYDITVADINSGTVNLPASIRFVKADLTNFSTCLGLARGMDVVIHLAAIVDETENYNAFELNCLLIQNVFRAAAESNCGRLIFASSAQTIEHHPNDLQIHVNRPVRPHNLYGVAKCMGEALASYYADQSNMSAVCLRIGAYEFENDHKEMNTRDLSAYLHPDDCNQLLVACIEKVGLHYEIINAISNNRYKRLDISDAIEKFGYQPRADAFELFSWKED